MVVPAVSSPLWAMQNLMLWENFNPFSRTFRLGREFFLVASTCAGAEVSGNVETWHGTLEAATAKLAPSQSPRKYRVVIKVS